MSEEKSDLVDGYRSFNYASALIFLYPIKYSGSGQFRLWEGGGGEERGEVVEEISVRVRTRRTTW